VCMVAAASSFDLITQNELPESWPRERKAIGVYYLPPLNNALTRSLLVHSLAAASVANTSNCFLCVCARVRGRARTVVNGAAANYYARQASISGFN
jgi:hypothetical protein